MSSEPELALGARIREARHRASLSQADLAKKLAVSLFTVSRWERGETCPSFQQMRGLAKVCAVTLDWLGDLPVLRQGKSGSARPED